VPRPVTALVGTTGRKSSHQCIAGIHEPDAGEILEGRTSASATTRSGAWASKSSTRTLRSATIWTCREHVLGRERLNRSLLDEDDMERAARQLSAWCYDRAIRPSGGGVPVRASASRRCRKAVMWNSKLVILDEPTAASASRRRSSARAGEAIGRSGLAVLMISHNLTTFCRRDRLAVMV